MPERDRRCRSFRYFDLLLLLIEHRHEAVHRQQIFDRVWSDAVVSESALSQAIRTIRRTLGDDSREPRFIRTVSRHGYRFVFRDVIEEEDDGARAVAALEVPAAADVASITFEPAALTQEQDRSTGQRAVDAVVNAWPRAAVGSALAGIAAGSMGGLVLVAAPGSAAPIAIVPVLAVIAGVAGAVGGTGVGVGLAIAEVTARSSRILAFTSAAALGGGIVGAAVQWLMRWGLASLVGLDLDIGGGVEGVVIGGCTGLGFAVATREAEEGFTLPRGQRLRAALITAVTCGIAGLALAFAGRPLAGGTIDAIADAAEGSRATLAPLGRLIGEPDFGPLSMTIAAVGECAAFGLGLAYGLLWRPRDGQPSPSSRS